MSLAYEISPSGDQVRVVGKGRMTADDFVDVIEHVIADPRNRPDSSALVDLRNATYKADNLVDVICIAKALETFHFVLQNKIAIVAKQSLLFPAEVVATHVRKTAHVAIRVFVDLAAAEAFLQGKAGTDASAYA